MNLIVRVQNLPLPHALVDLAFHAFARGHGSDISTAAGLIHRTTEMLALSSWLETPVGHYAVCSAVSFVPAAAIIIAAVDCPETAMRVTAVGILLLSPIIAGSFWVCVKSLVRVIDESIDKRKARVHAKDGGGGDEALVAARKKVTRALGFTARQVTLMCSLLVFAIFSEYGAAAPLLIFDLPMVVITVLKMMVGVQLSAGRSKLDTLPGLIYRVGLQITVSRTSQAISGLNRFFCPGKIVPIKNLSTFGHTYAGRRNSSNIFRVNLTRYVYSWSTRSSLGLSVLVQIGESFRGRSCMIWTRYCPPG